jgi:hypothetical protein
LRDFYFLFSNSSKNGCNIMRILLTFLLVFSFICFSCKNEPKHTPSPTALKQMAEGIDTLTGQPIMAENPWKNNACALVTDAEMTKLFGIADPAKDVNTRTLPDQSFCLRKWNKPDWKERGSANDNPNNKQVDVYNRLVIKVVNFYRDNLAASEFESIKKNEATEGEVITDLGEGAFWNNNNTTLTIKKKSFTINLTVNHTDVPHDNLAKAREVAAIVLPKL